MSDAVLVPREPTEAMLRAGANAPYPCDAVDVWKSMLAASPSVGGWEGSRFLLVDLNAAPFTREFFDALNGYATGGSGRCLDTLSIWNAWLAPPPVSTGSRPQEAVPTERANGAVVADETVDRAARVVERFRTKPCGWSAKQFEVWFTKDPLFCQKVDEWGSFRGTAKQKLFYETRLALEAAEGCSSNEGADGWIEWSGGENPAGGSVLDIRFRDGTTGCWNADEPSWRDFWLHRAGGNDIIAYRILPQTEKGL